MAPALRQWPDGRHATVRLPWRWLLPVIRRRERSLRIGGLQPAGQAALLEAAQHALPPAWRRSRGVELRLVLQTRMVWGALAEPAPGPGGVSWRPCAVRADGVQPTPWRWTVDHGRCAGAIADAASPLERRLRGGVGLMLLQPVLRLERPAPPAAVRLHAQGRAWLQRVAGGEHATDPAFARRLSAAEAFWAGRLPDAVTEPAAQAAALRRGAWLRPASRRALRHGDAAIEREHVVLLPDAGGSVRDGFGDALAPAAPSADTAHEAPMWPGLPVLDGVAAWRFELDAWRPLDHQLERLAAAVEKQIVAPAGPLARGHRLVLLGHGSGGCLARFALDGLRRSVASRGWRVEALAIGSPQLGADLAAFGAEAWPPSALPRGLADLLPAAIQARAGGDAARLPPGLWLMGSVWGLGGDGGPGRVIDDPSAPPAADDGRFALRSALAGRTPPRSGDAPPDDGVVVIDASPALHAHYLALPAVRRQVQRALDHLLGREGSWA
ncbi:hypothetical protein [Aquabacterium humicola]|uniref:hypothetical protein n=1 Tax=Aquabacterium humicola TaxID=3237377 RepID=UPI002542998E|nr:hypothetical protein [Rubrivivax pictus]